MSDPFKNSFASPLKRDFVPCARIAAQAKTAGAEVLPGCRITRGFIGNDCPVCTVAPGGFLLLDFGLELSGGVRLVTAGDMPHARIRLRFGESCSEAMDRPTPDHAIHDAEFPIPPWSSTDFGNTGFRFVRIDALDHSLRLHNVIAVYEHRDDVQQGTFRSSDPLLDRIFDTCVHTVRLNMQDYLLDGVKRDRLVWGGDMNPEAMVILRVFGDAPVLRDTMELLRAHTPQEGFINGFPSYSLWYFITLYDHYLHTGNMTLLKDNQPFLEREALRFSGMVDGNGRECLPARRFLDWPSDACPEIVHAGLQALLLMGLRVMQRMLKQLHSAVTLSEAVLKKLQSHVPDPQGSKAAAALQMLSGMADRTAVLGNDPFSGVSTFFGYYVLLAKQPQTALELVRKYWGAMLGLGATSFWEDFDLDWVPNATRIDELPVPGRPDIHKDFGAYCYTGLRHSLCHGWAAGPAAWCSRKILGVEPLAPGFAEIGFQPDLCDLEFAEGTIPTPHGIIKVELKKGKEPEITLPEGVTIRKQDER